MRVSEAEGQPMKLVTFQDMREERLGALVGDGVLDLVDAAAARGETIAPSLQALIEGGASMWNLARDIIATRPETAVRHDVALLAPLPRPVRLRDASLFLDHMEAALQKVGRTMSPRFREQVIYYNADHVHVFGPDADIPWPRLSEWRDYELEWACVIGKPGVNIAAEDARDHIFGYTLFNDWSARDLQFPFMEAGLGPGAGKDFANSLGPCIVTTDEVPDPYALQMIARVNGETWSRGTTGSMHHRFEDAIVQLSRDRPLVAGEIIGSGTVLSGCGLELDRRLALGDVVELELERVGILRNRVVAA
ncbi:fumarylacetoacetate hydrolase family protein [uncultured Sphingomonas sp.]|uniref:fumarylacetoacetate hydrolase family protein n=1 Tax=uncultured Sphingomonas sp. TaxID=158754 RepID=UPI0035CB4878